MELEVNNQIVVLLEKMIGLRENMQKKRTRPGSEISVNWVVKMLKICYNEECEIEIAFVHYLWFIGLYI